jgi:hypothetical protein
VGIASTGDPRREIYYATATISPGAILRSGGPGARGYAFRHEAFRTGIGGPVRVVPGGLRNGARGGTVQRPEFVADDTDADADTDADTDTDARG